MANKLEYIFSLRDQISSKLGNITAVSDKTRAALSGVQDKVKAADGAFADTGKSIATLKLRIDALQAEREWIPADNIPAIKEYNEQISRLTRELNDLETAAGGGKFKKWASDAFSAIPGSDLLRNPLVAAVSAVGFSGRQAMNFDEGMAQVNITAQLDDVQLEELKEKLKGIAVENKTDITLAPKGFEAINSQLNDVDLSLSILDAALKGSKAGFTNVDTVAAALAQTLSIVGQENTTAMEVLDTFFASKRVGAGEFEDFAQYMPKLIAGASNLGIAYKEVAGTFAYMTGKGQSAERAAVLMENAFSVLGRAEVRKKMEAAGIDVFDDAGKIRGIVDIFSDMQGVLGGLNDEQKSMLLEGFGLVDKEAKNAFAVLMSDTEKLRSTMDEVSQSAGETQKNLEFSSNAVQKATEVWNQLKNIGATVGEVILPVINAALKVSSIVLSGVAAVLGTVTGFFSGWFGLLQEGHPLVVGLTAALGVFTAAMAANYAITNKAVIIGGVKKALDLAQTIATSGLTAAQWALNAAFYASPLGWIALAIGAVVTAVTLCWQKFEGFRVVVLGIWEVIKEFGRSLWDSIVTPFKQILSGIGGVCSALMSLLKGNFQEAATAAKEGFKDIGKGIIGTNPITVAYNTVNSGAYTAAWEKGKQAGHDSWAASQLEEQKTEQAVPVVPQIPDLPDASAATPDFEALMRQVNASKAGKGKNTLKLDTVKTDLNESAEYTAVTRKLAPTVVSFVPAAVPVSGTGNAVPGTAETPQNRVDDYSQEYDRTEGNYLLDIMLNVRRIAAAAAVAVPVALTVAAPPVQAAEPTPVIASAPAINIPDITVPAIDVPAGEAPSVSVDSPDVGIPDVSVAAPAVSVPDVAVPAVDVPTAEAPGVSVVTPVVGAPDVSVAAPAVSIPDIAVPAVDIPAGEAPSVSVAAPVVDIPDVSVAAPAVSIPDITVPAVDVPTADAVPVPEISEAYDVENVRETNNTYMSENIRTTNNSGRTINIGKICDEVVIHVQNTDNKGADTIRAEIMRILNELAEG